jgi:hypothetical protein
MLTKQNLAANKDELHRSNITHDLSGYMETETQTNALPKSTKK